MSAIRWWEEGAPMDPEQWAWLREHLSDRTRTRHLFEGGFSSSIPRKSASENTESVNPPAGNDKRRRSL